MECYPCKMSSVVNSYWGWLLLGLGLVPTGAGPYWGWSIQGLVPTGAGPNWGWSQLGWSHGAGPYWGWFQLGMVPCAQAEKEHLCL